MIRMKKLFRLQSISRLRLIAGQDGLERSVTAAVLFEYDPSRMQLPDFYRGDLVVTTLAYARGDAQLVAHSLLALMNQGIAGLLVKTAYFDELPQSVIDLANRLGTPIFLFDDTYIEEVILQVTDLIRGKRHFAGYEKDIDALMQGELTDEQIRQRVQRIDPVGLKGYRVYALFPKERMPQLEDRIYALLEEDAQVSHRFIFMEWRRMLIALCRLEGTEEGKEENAFAALEVLLARAGVTRETLALGASRNRSEQTALGMALCEAIYAARTAKMLDKPSLCADELGVYAYLFPMSENAFICDRCTRAFASIREYDAQNHTSLAHTAQVYVEQNMEIAAAAKALFQHPNTVRYRLSKIQHILNMEGNPLFDSMLNVIVRLIRILEEGRS